MQAANAPELLSRIGSDLDGCGARWSVIGALAVAYHGVVRGSLDADALVSFKDAKISAREFAEELRSKGLSVDYREGDSGDPIGFVLRIRDAAGNQVNLLGGIRKTDPEIFHRSIGDEPEGLKLRFASVEDLLALKLFAGGPKDLEDAAGVLAASGDSVDQELLSRLCHRFGHVTEKRLRKLLGR